MKQTDTMEDRVLDILNSLVQEIGHQVTRDYEFKGGIWEGMSISNENSRQKYAKTLLTLIQEEKDNDRKKFEIEMIVSDLPTNYTGTATTLQEYSDNMKKFIKDEIEKHEIAIKRLKSL